MIDSMERFENILCVIEDGEGGTQVLERAVMLAESFQAHLTIVEVVPEIRIGPIGKRDSRLLSGDRQAEMVRERESWLETLAEPYRERVDIAQRVLVGTSFLEIIREVIRNQCDLVIRCPESPSWLDRLFSGDDMHLLRKCPCPVWIVKPPATRAYDHVLAAVDVDDGYSTRELVTRQQLNASILETAASLAISESAELHIANAWESMTELLGGLAFSSGIARDSLHKEIAEEESRQRRLVDECIGQLKVESKFAKDALDYLRPQIHLVKGPAGREIPGLARRLAIDCVVMGTVARTGVPGFIIGNTAETILGQLECSVLALKPPGFVTPVVLDGETAK
jgi:nucleotide-binding universal stress UspA family protein